MLEDIVEKRLESTLGAVESQLRACLQWCQSPTERLLFLEFLQLPGAQPTGCSGQADPFRMRMFSGGFLDSAKALPIAEDDSGQWVPTGLVWLDELIQHRVFYHETKSECCRLIPKFPVKDDESGELVCTIDLALFWPRGDGNGYVKIAIECDGEERPRKTERQEELENLKHKSLRELGWIVTSWTEEEIRRDPTAIVNEIRKVALKAQSQLRKERRSP